MMSWPNNNLNLNQNEQLYWGYPNFMQSSANPMQSGFRWSSFSEPHQNENGLQQYMNSSYQMPSTKIDGINNSAATHHAGYYSSFGGLQAAMLGNSLNKDASQNLLDYPPNIAEPQVRNAISNVIFAGRNPMAVCNAYCRSKGLVMEFEQTGEEGPPHQPVFTFCLKISNLQGGLCEAVGRDRRKVEAKDRAAAAMVPKLQALFGELPLDFLNKERHRRPTVRKSEFKDGSKSKPRLTTEEEDIEWAKARPLDSEKNNPVSILHDWANRKKVAMPIFEMTSQDIIDSREGQGPNGRRITINKSIFTIRCSFMGKEFEGKDNNKKKAKFLAATAAWREFMPTKVFKKEESIC